MRGRFLAADAVRITPAPLADVRNKRVRVTAIDGASIGYRIGDGPWLLYREPIARLPETLTVKAQRYGWAASEPVTVPP